jgi:hypothetical protein
MRRRWIALGALTVALAGAATGVAYAATNGDGDGDKPLTGEVLEQASAAALTRTGGGTVVETEAGDDGAAYGVEVRTRDGKQIEISLDDKFNVVRQEGDDDSGGESQGDR